VIGVFLLGFLAGALALYYFLWRTGGLAPRHLLARTTSDLVNASAAVTPRFPRPAATPATLPPQAPAAVAPAPEPTLPPRTPFEGFAIGREPLVMPVDGGNPLTMRVTVPQTGLTEAVDMGTKVKAIGLTLVTDVKNGKAWYVYKASALKIAKG